MGLGPRGIKLLHAKILELYAAFGILAGGMRYPTLFDLYEAVAGDKRANPQARQLILDSLDPVLRDIGDVLSYSYGWEISELAKRCINFQLDGASDPSKDLLYNTVVLGAFQLGLAQGISNAGMGLYICCDEAARLVGSSDNSISDLISVVRGTGIGLDLSLQSAEVSRAVLANTPNKFIGRLTSYADLEVLSSSIGLTRDQRRWLSRNLVPGLFVGQLGQGEWRHPFVFRIPRMNLKRRSEACTSYVGDLDRLPSLRQTKRLRFG